MPSQTHWRVLVPGSIHGSGQESLREFADLTRIEEYDTREDARAAVADGAFDAVVVRTLELDRDTIAAGDRLRIVSKHGIGLDNVDVAAASEHGVVVTRTPGQNVGAVAEHAVGMVLAARKRFLPATADVRAGEWARERYVGPELRGDVLGIYGLGDIGRRVADLAAGLGMDVAAYDPYVDPGEAPDGVAMVDSVAALADAADALTVHAPLTGETEGAVGAEALERLPAHGVVVNCARGGIVDEAALDDALGTGSLAGAGLDVFAEEPPDPETPLLARENVIATPHCAGSTTESLRGMSEAAAANVRAVYEGRVPGGAVNADAVGGGTAGGASAGDER
jgi:D-3-phosphoglycerate dehydrogenase